MLFKITTILVIATFACVVIAQDRIRQDDILEWVDYTDEISEDAIPVGRTSFGDYIYVGLAHVIDGESEGYIPATIRAGTNYVNVTLNEKPHMVSENVKILCGKNNYLEKVTWAVTDDVYFMELFDHDDYRPVRAGWEASKVDGKSYNTSVYIGNGYYPGGYYVGKIYTSHANPNKNHALLIDAFGNENTYFHSFGALIYYTV